MYEDLEGSKDYLEKDEAAVLVCYWRRYMESHGLDMRHKAKCGHTVVERRLRMEKHGMVEEHESPENWEIVRQAIEKPSYIDVGYDTKLKSMTKICKSGKRRKTGASALCTMDDGN